MVLIKKRNSNTGIRYVRMGVLVVCCIYSKTCYAMPTGAPQCLEGNAATIGHTEDGTALSTQSITVTMMPNTNDGEGVSSELDPSVPYEVMSDTTYTITIGGTSIEGIMVRLASSSSAVDVTNALSISSDNTDPSLLQIGPCIGPDSISITHTSEDEKENIMITFDPTDLGSSGEFVLDVTSVYSKKASVHSGYTIALVAGDGGGTVSDGTTAEPTQAPVSGGETGGGDDKDPTDPTTSPTNEPVVSEPDDDKEGKDEDEEEKDGQDNDQDEKEIDDQDEKEMDDPDEKEMDDPDEKEIDDPDEKEMDDKGNDSTTLSDPKEDETSADLVNSGSSTLFWMGTTTAITVQLLSLATLPFLL